MSSHHKRHKGWICWHRTCYANLYDCVMFLSRPGNIKNTRFIVTIKVMHVALLADVTVPQIKGVPKNFDGQFHYSILIDFRYQMHTKFYLFFHVSRKLLSVVYATEHT